MATSDALVVGEHWISEHFFTTEAKGESFAKEVLELRKRWEDQGADSARARVTAARSELEAALAALFDDDGEPRQDEEAALGARELYGRLRVALGFHDPGRAGETSGDVRFVRTPGTQGVAPLVIVDAAPVAAVEDLLDKERQTLLEPWQHDDGDPVTSVPRLLSTLLVGDETPDFALVLAGRWLLVTDKERW